MPYYDYRCTQCGVFELQRSMGEASLPALCPVCQGGAQRIISAPFLATLKATTRIAYARNERSAHEPRVEHRDGNAGGGQHHPHRHPHRHVARRPWMIGH